jgi:CubicO group peptidase (beta-lactamase class C family)
MRSFLLGIGLFFCFDILASAADNSTQHSTTTQILNAEVDSFINNVLAEWNSPGGVAVAVVRMDSQGGWLVETKGYGVAKADGTKVGPDTIFSIGSNSKASFWGSHHICD